MSRRGKTLLLHSVANAALMLVLFLHVVFCACFNQAHSDGGVVQFQKPAGQFLITAFTTPSPLRAGPVDISLMVQNLENKQPVLDCKAVVQLLKQGATSIRSEATHEAAQNKLFYAALMKIPESGVWELEAFITHGSESVKVAGAIGVAPSNPVIFGYWRSLAIPLLLIPLFVLNQWLKRRSVKGARL